MRTNRLEDEDFWHIFTPVFPHLKISSTIFPTKKQTMHWIGAFLVLFKISSSYRLYNLTSDPYEATDVADYDSYSAIGSEMLTSCEDWASEVVDPVYPDTTNMTTAFAECGGVCAWLDSGDDDDYSDDNVQTYFYDSAPHIVFVLVDDWGYNELGMVSNYMSWTTPNIDSLANEGILLTNYFTHTLCIPTRGALLTGRYSIRLGLYPVSDDYQELPLTETTLAQELSLAGYRNYLIGKWHMGFSTDAHWPTRRGFDYFYGYLNGYSDYYTKYYGSYLDLHEDMDLVTDETELSSDLHAAYLYQTKAEAVIANHSTYYSGTPMFLYYAMQLVHTVYAVPSIYSDRCADATTISEMSGDDYTVTEEILYCGLNLMLDEAIANLTCTLETYGMSNNTVLIIAGDNGGDNVISGTSYPFKGHKSTNYRGGVSVNAIIHSKLVDEDRRGGTYDGVVHVTGTNCICYSFRIKLVMKNIFFGRLVPNSDGSGNW